MPASAMETAGSGKLHRSDHVRHAGRATSSDLAAARPPSPQGQAECAAGRRGRASCMGATSSGMPGERTSSDLAALGHLPHRGRLSAPLDGRVGQAAWERPRPACRESEPHPTSLPPGHLPHRGRLNAPLRAVCAAGRQGRASCIAATMSGMPGERTSSAHAAARPSSPQGAAVCTAGRQGLASCMGATSSAHAAARPPSPQGAAECPLRSAGEENIRLRTPAQQAASSVTRGRWTRPLS